MAQLSYQLKSRHILMIALGSAIGTGLFLGSTQSIALTGPSILLAYLISGIIMYIVIRALSEMVVHEPNSGSFSYYAYKYMGRYAGFITGWNYWFNYIVVCMLELTASSFFIDYFVHWPHWIVVLSILLIFGAINLIGVLFFAEFEFYFAGIKVLTILLMIALGIYIIFFNNAQYPESHISNLWNYGGFFAHGIHGFLLSFVAVIFSFGGIELIGVASGDTKDARKIIPVAVNGVIVRILVFYIATLAIIMCLYPWNKIDPHMNPFVDVLTKIGIMKAAAIMNVIAITAALSSFNSGLYTTSRMLYNLALQGNASKVFTKLDKKHTPYIATIFSLLFILVVVGINYLYPQKVFMWLIALATSAAILSWIFILITHAVFRYSKINSSYKLPWHPLLSCIACIFFLVIISMMAKSIDTRLAVCIMPIWVLLLSVVYYVKRNI